MTNKEIKKAKEDFYRQFGVKIIGGKAGGRPIYFDEDGEAWNFIESLLTQQAKQHKAELEEIRRRAGRFRFNLVAEDLNQEYEDFLADLESLTNKNEKENTNT